MPFAGTSAMVNSLPALANVCVRTVSAGVESEQLQSRMAEAGMRYGPQSEILYPSVIVWA